MNTIINFFERQLKEEAELTRKMLKIVPEDRYDWQPHPKSMTICRLSTHIAELLSWVPLGINTDVLDFAAGNYQPTLVSSNSELLRLFEENQMNALDSLSKTTDEYLQNPWT